MSMEDDLRATDLRTRRESPTTSAGVPLPMPSLDSPNTAASHPRASTTHYVANDSPPPLSTLRNSRPSTATSARSSGPGTVSETGKRKRSRVTPEQLQHLERIFAQDRSPTAARRKEISEMLGMHERQTQIWFQNRRAKAKNLDSKTRATRTSPSSSPSEIISDPTVLANDIDRQILVHEDHAVNFIPCNDLTIGNWRRIASTTTRNDLLAYSCDAKRCIAWYIQSSGIGFKMEIPYDIITRVELNAMPQQHQPDLVRASFFLSGVPAFFLDRIIPPPMALAPGVQSWQNCQDWTEGGQASAVVRHDIVGPLGPMTTALSKIPLGSRIVGLGAQPFYGADASLTLLQPPPMTLPTAPPVPIAFSLPNPSEANRPSVVQGRKRSYSGPPPHSQSASEQSAYGDTIGLVHNTRPSSLQFNIPYPSAEHAPQYAAPMFTYVPPPLSQHSPAHATPSPIDYTAGPIAHTSTSYPTQLPGSAEVGMSYSSNQSRDMGSFSSTSSGHSFGSSSPPLLTQPFHPAAGSTRGLSSQDSSAMDIHGITLDPSMLTSMVSYTYQEETMVTDSVQSSSGLDLSMSGSSLDGALTPPQ